MNTETLSKLIAERLERNSKKLSEEFSSSNIFTSTKFFFIDDLLPEEFVLDVYDNLPERDTYNFRDTFRERKFTFSNLNDLDNPIIDNIASAFQMDNVVKAVEKITKINHLESDPSLYAGGISRMDLGHFLNPHIDNSHDADKKKYRRFNILFYIAPDIQESDGGNLELWDQKVKKPFKIASKFNRLVVMETNKYSWHSVDPVCKNIHRCCVSSYFFSKSSPEDFEYYHVTSFMGRPNEFLKRTYGVVDNFLRNYVVKTTGFSRGKKFMKTIDKY